MSWQRSIERNTERLKEHIAPLIALIGMYVPSLRARILKILRPAEAATRRLIVIAALDIHEKPACANASPGSPPDFSRFRKDTPALPRFRLIDPRKSFATRSPKADRPCRFARICVPGITDRAAAPLPVERIDDGESLKRRVLALKAAAENIPAQARRMAKLMAKRSVISGPKGIGPIRPGLPPGLLRTARRQRHGLQFFLADMHQMAMDRMAGMKPPP